MRLRYLLEGVTDTVFHITEDRYAKNIIRDDEFIFSLTKFSSAPVSDEMKKKYPYYASLTRSPQSGYVLNEIKKKKTFVMFEIDGKKLSHNYKGTPVDFYSLMSFKEKTETSPGDERASEKRDGVFFEMEDRIFSKKEKIKKFSRYVKAAHILKAIDSETNRDFFRDIGEVNRPYPIYLYNDKKDFLFLRTNKARKL